MINILDVYCCECILPHVIQAKFEIHGRIPIEKLVMKKKCDERIVLNLQDMKDIGTVDPLSVMSEDITGPKRTTTREWIAIVHLNFSNLIETVVES